MLSKNQEDASAAVGSSVTHQLTIYAIVQGFD
jgi:hypothetical protein